jgi:hypothetical protein
LRKKALAAAMSRWRQPEVNRPTRSVHPRHDLIFSFRGISHVVLTTGARRQPIDLVALFESHCSSGARAVARFTVQFVPFPTDCKVDERVSVPKELR